MRFRTGRKQDRNVYAQLGDHPSDEDEYVGVIFDPRRAEVIVAILNGERPPAGDGGLAGRQYEELTAEGAGPLLSPACRDGDCWACEGAPCEHPHHRASPSSESGVAS